MVLDPPPSSALPVFHWFMDDDDYENATCSDPAPPCHLLTDDTEPAVLFYDGKLFDAVEVRVRKVFSSPRSIYRLEISLAELGYQRITLLEEDALEELLMDDGVRAQVEHFLA